MSSIKSGQSTVGAGRRSQNGLPVAQMQQRTPSCTAAEAAEHPTGHPCTTKLQKMRVWCTKRVAAIHARARASEAAKILASLRSAAGAGQGRAVVRPDKNIEPVLHQQGVHLRNLKTLGRLPRLAQ